MRKKKDNITLLSGAVLVWLGIHLFLPGAAAAQAPFYQGKTITLVVGAGAGGMGDLRARALAAFLLKHIPGNPMIVFQYLAGGGGRVAANYIYNSARPDGLTMLRVASSIVPYAVLGEDGVRYDIDRLIYLGTTEHILYYLFYTRRDAGLNSLEKLRATQGVRIGSSAVGHTGYLLSRAMAYLVGMNDRSSSRDTKVRNLILL